MAEKEKEKEEETLECIEKYKKLKNSGKEILDTMDRSHRGAWLYAEKEVLMEDGRIKRKKLDDSKVRLEFADAMADHYDQSLEDYFLQKGEGLDENEKEILRLAYSGTTRAELRSTATQLGKKFDFKHFYEKFVPESMKIIKNTIQNASYNHLNIEHIDDILKYTKSEDIFDAEALKENPQVAHSILAQFEQQGVLTPEYIKELSDNPSTNYFLKAEHKKKPGEKKKD